MSTAPQRLLIKNGTLIDGSECDPAKNTLIVIEGNRITQVDATDGSMRPPSADDKVIDATGKFILPGLIDAHCHISLHQGALPGVRYTSRAEFCTLWAAYAIGRVLRAGVTSIVVPGGKWFTDVTVREAVEAGLIEGPRMVVASRALSNYGGIFDPDPYPAFEGTPADTAGVLCNTRDEFIRETRKQCKRGVDLIKIADSYWGDIQTCADDEIAAVVDEAHRHNVKVAIHSRGSTSTRAAAKAGVDVIYHGDLATEADLDIVARAGMPIVAGSDTGNASAFAHGKWHGKEAELFVKEIGMTPMEAILACTSRNAELMGLEDEVGVIAPGKLADIVIWNSDPLADITVLQRPSEISAVIKDGRIVDRVAHGFRELAEEPSRARMLASG